MDSFKTSLFLILLVMVAIKNTSSEIVCQDLVEKQLCDHLLNDRSQCNEYPWNSKCRKTCGRCDECYPDAESMMTCNSQKDRCDDITVAHECSKTCGVLGCEKETRRVFHMP